MLYCIDRRPNVDIILECYLAPHAENLMLYWNVILHHLEILCCPGMLSCSNAGNNVVLECYLALMQAMMLYWSVILHKCG